MPGWADRLRSLLRGRSKATAASDTYHALRSISTGADITTIEPPDGEPLRGVAIAMIEIGLDRGVATVVAIADGSVSMYLSTGGGVLGAGGHAAVRGAAERFRVTMADARHDLQPTAELPLPEPGMVRFHARTADGDWTASASEESLRRGRHPLAELYAAGQDLITEIRLASPDESSSAGRPA